MTIVAAGGVAATLSPAAVTTPGAEGDAAFAAAEAAGVDAAGVEAAALAAPARGAAEAGVFAAGAPAVPPLVVGCAGWGAVTIDVEGGIVAGDAGMTDDEAPPLSMPCVAVNAPLAPLSPGATIST